MMLIEGQAVIVLLHGGSPVTVRVENPDCWGPSFSVDRSIARLGDPYTFDYADGGITWTADTSPAGIDALCAAAQLASSQALPGVIQGFLSARSRRASS